MNEPRAPIPRRILPIIYPTALRDKIKFRQPPIWNTNILGFGEYDSKVSYYQYRGKGPLVYVGETDFVNALRTAHWIATGGTMEAVGGPYFRYVPHSMSENGLWIALLGFDGDYLRPGGVERNRKDYVVV